ncbi:rRNA pseudouridine synthase [[Mycoplasma] falconis]|uniref:Pseudouridine synthase n=1 Tax=[Mycoplasma] falconis TaxID=92403 RepID=A0A501X9Y8_9BACT|nr:pseudouridine synthase [[Mycoplasma] falconis]TPE57365.1 rRNA pseudouridine synthase [[Mycoplasma] falconis]
MENQDIKLQKRISEIGFCSRREAERLIAENKVLVNGELAYIGMRVNNHDEIKINGKVITLNKPKKIVYILLNKPQNTICTLKDPQERRTIYQYLKIKEHMFSVGRLDFNTTGVIIITNDGELANLLAHPSSQIEREYLVELEKPLEEKELNYLNSNKVMLNGKPSKQIVKQIGNNKYSIKLREGRNHHVKNLFLLVNNYVKKLHRKSYGPINHNALKIGDWRYLTQDEVNILKALVNKDIK